MEGDSALKEIMRKAAEKKKQAIERRKEREVSGEENRLLVEKDHTGLYTCRYALNGKLPDALIGKFTRVQQILDIAKVRNIKVEV